MRKIPDLRNTQLRKTSQRTGKMAKQPCPAQDPVTGGCHSARELKLLNPPSEPYCQPGQGSSLL